MARKRGTKTRTVINPNIDSEWFENTLRDLDISIRSYAKRPEVKSSHSVISRMFRGKKQFTPNDGRTFSQVTGAPYSEVMKRAGGFTETEIGEGLAVVGWLDEKRRVHVEGVRGPKKVALPPDMSSGSVALRYQTAGTALASMDGAVIYCRPLGMFDSEMLGHWCCVKVRGGGRLVRILKKGRAGKFDLLDYDDRARMDGVEVEAASRVEWVKF
jgi:hypothetical protein